MPIKLPPKSGGSNKSQTLPKTADLQAYSSHPVDPEVLPTPTPIIDKLSVILTPKTNTEAASLHKDLYQSLMNDPQFFQSGGKPTTGFKVVKLIALASSIHRVRLDYAYAAGRAKKIRLEFNPSQIGLDGLQDLHNVILTVIDGGWRRFIKQGIISRLDIAVDFPGVRMSKIMVMPATGSTVQQWKHNGKLQTYQQGKVGGNHIQIYNKQAQLAKKGAAAKSTPNLVRLEARLKPPKPKLLAQIAEIGSPFAGFMLATELPNCPPAEPKEYIWTMFRDSVALRGLGPALALLPKGKRTLYRQCISKSSAPPWWQPEAIWASWPTTLDQLKLSSPSAWT